MTRVLAGDIGGTKTILALYNSESGPHQPEIEKTYPSASYASLEAIVAEFLASLDASSKAGLAGACFGVAGPVVDGRATITNLPWRMDETELAAALDVERVALLNDLVSVAHAVPQLKAENVHTVNEGQGLPGGPIAVIAPGTGLGEAYLLHDGTRYQAYASEGGHSSFAPSTDLEQELLHFLTRTMHHVSYERVCSGIGIPNIYRFLKESGHEEEPAWLAEQLASVTDPTPVIMDTARSEQSCTICQQTLSIFMSILGGEAGNLVLKVLATGGVYLGGGIPPRIRAELTQPEFMDSFTNKGRFRSMMQETPVKIILNPKAGLLGAASYGLDL